MGISLLGVDWFKGIKDTISAYLSLIPKFIYYICSMILSILDLVQLVFRKIAGLDAIAYKVNGNYNYIQEGKDITMLIFSEPIVLEVLFSITLLAVIILAVTTIVAVLRAEFIAEDFKSASKGRVLIKSFRALLSFAVVPAICVFGIFLSNVLLRALDKATISPTEPFEGQTAEVFYNQPNFVFFGMIIPTNNMPFSGMVFRASMFNANRIRVNKEYCDAMVSAGRGNETITYGGVFSPASAGSSGIVSDSEREKAATMVDSAFCYGFRLREDYRKTTIRERIDKSGDNAKNVLASYTKCVVLDTKALDVPVEVFSRYSVSTIWLFYDMWSFNIFVGYGAAIIMTTLMMNLAFGAMKRVYELIILFLISPPIVATTPLINDPATGPMKEWRNSFITTLVHLYSPIIVMNLFFMIVPFISNISFFGENVNGIYKPIVFADILIQTLAIIAGMYTIKDLSKTINTIILRGTLTPGVKAPDAFETGAGVGRDVMGAMGHVIQSVGGVGLAAANTIVHPVRGATVGFSESRQDGLGRGRSFLNALGRSGKELGKSMGGLGKSVTFAPFGKIMGKVLGDTGILDPFENVIRSGKKGIAGIKKKMGDTSYHKHLNNRYERSGENGISINTFMKNLDKEDKKYMAEKIIKPQHDKIDKEFDKLGFGADLSAFMANYLNSARSTEYAKDISQKHLDSAQEAMNKLYEDIEFMRNNSREVNNYLNYSHELNKAKAAGDKKAETKYQKILNTVKNTQAVITYKEYASKYDERYKAAYNGKRIPPNLFDPITGVLAKPDVLTEKVDFKNPGFKNSPNETWKGLK